MDDEENPPDCSPEQRCELIRLSNKVISKICTQLAADIITHGMSTLKEQGLVRCVAAAVTVLERPYAGLDISTSERIEGLETIYQHIAARAIPWQICVSTHLGPSSRMLLEHDYFSRSEAL